VVGGPALALLGVTKRPTRDVDILQTNGRWPVIVEPGFHWVASKSSCRAADAGRGREPGLGSDAAALASRCPPTRRKDSGGFVDCQGGF